MNRKANIKCGSYINYHSNNTTIEEAFREYRFNDIQEDDIFLDIGANVGGVSLFVSKMVKHVYAVEPVMTAILQSNVDLNKINNITVLNEALGSKVNWGGVINKVTGKSLTEIIKMCDGHVDFLKCDCEGGEWAIKPDELKNIRRIEMEVHTDEDKKFEDYINMLTSVGFRCTYKTLGKHTTLVHGRRLWNH